MEWCIPFVRHSIVRKGDVGLQAHATHVETFVSKASDAMQ